MKKSLVLAAAMLAALFVHAQTFDPDFKPVFSNDGTATSGLLLNDSKYILAGSFIKAGTAESSGIVKFNSDGSIDNSFVTGTGITGIVYDLAAQADGKVIVIGRISKYNDVTLQSMVIRLNTDGSLDETFLARINFSNAGSKIHLKIQSDGKIIVVGPVDQIAGQSKNEDIILLNSDGTWDDSFNGPNFNGSIQGFDIQANGKIIAGGFFTSIDGTTTNRICRLNTDGTVDNSFDIGTGFNNTVYDVKVLGIDRILMTGSFSTYNGASNAGLVALKADGTVDATFSGNGKLTSGQGRCLATQSDGKILLAGSLGTFDGNSSIKNIMRLTTTGALDGTFTPGTGPNSTVDVMKVNSANETIILGANITSYNGQARNGVAILDGSGTLNTTAVTPFYTAASTLKIEKQGTDKILVSHNGKYIDGAASDGFERLTLDGAVDGTFNGGPVNNSVNEIIIDQNNNIVIGGAFTSYNSVSVGRVARLNANGTLDATFNTNTGTGFNGSVTAIAEQPDGKLIVGGNFTDFNGTTIKNLARLNADGTLDNQFNVADGFSATSGTIRLEVFRVLPDGKILVGGEFTSFDGHNIQSLIRLNDDGSFDDTFNVGTGLYRSGSAVSSIYALEVLEDGKIMAGGSFDRVNGVSESYCVRLNSDGSLDDTYTKPSPSYFIVDAFGRQDDGKILVGSRTPSGLTRLYKNGLQDLSFNLITSPGIRDILHFDKQIIIGGNLSTVSGYPVAGLAKVTLPEDPAAPTALSVNVISHASASMTWTDNATNEDGFKIERSTPDNSSFQVIQTLGANVTSYQDNTLQENTTYHYRVASFNANSDDNYSNEDAIATLPAIPSGLAVEIISSTQLDLSWTDNSNHETAYEVERSAGDADHFEPLISLGANVTQHADNNALIAGTVYYYRVRAVIGSNYSPYTTAVSAAPSTAAPSSLALADPTPTSVQLTWTDNAIDEDEYIIKRSDGGNLNYITIATLPADTETFTDTGLTPGTLYYYTVHAANATSESQPASGNITPGVFIMANGTNSLCDGVFYDPGGEFTYNNNLNVTTTFLPATTGASLQIEFQYFATQFLFDALSIYDGTDVSAPLIGIFDSTDDPGTIRATNADGALTFQFQSDGSSVNTGWKAYFSCVIVPQEPSAVDVEPVNTSQIKVTWTDNSDNETGFVVERSVNNASSFNTIADLPPNATFYDDNDVTSNTTFYYRVKAKGNDTDSDFAPMTAIAYGEGIWKLKADFDGIARTDATAFAIEGKGYLGLGWAGGAQANNFRAFDPATNTWSVIDSYGGSIRSEAAAFVIGSKAYVGTGEGFDLENDLWEYDPSLNDWIAKADFGGTARRDAVGFSINGKGYIGLGTDASGRTSDVWQYDPAGNAWTEVAPFPGSARTGAVAFVINDIAYVGTGSSSSGNTNDFWKYDAGSNTWTAIAAFPGNARRHAVAFALNNKGYVGTGESASDHDDFWEYDPATDTWREVVSFGGGARYVASSFATSAHGYVGTGFDGSNRKDLWEFTMTDVPAPPAAPEQLAATVISNTEISLTWQYTGNATGFILERSIGGEAAYTVIAEPSATATSYVDTGLNPMTAYYYRIKAVYPSGNSPFSASANATTFPEPPDAPSGLEAFTVTYSIAWLRWVDNSFSENEFVIERSENTADNFETIETVSINATEFGDQTVKAKTVYHYRVKAVNSGGSSGYSNTITITTADPPVLAPSNLTAVATNTAIALTWDDNSNNETGFYIFRSATDTDNFVYLASVTSNTTSYRDSNVEENITYYYRVRAASNDYETDFSNIASATRPLSIPFPPSALTAQLNETDDIITLSWTSNSENHDDFVIERSFDGTNFSEHGTSTTTDYQDSDFGDAVKTYYRVLARNGAGNSAYSNTATVIITGIEGATLNDAVTVSPNPADHHIFVEFSSPESGNVQVELSDITGKVISKLAFEKPEVQFTQRIDVVKPSGGIMLMKISLNKMTAVKKVIFK